VIRSATASDAAALAGLWRAAGLKFRPELVAGELAAVVGQGLVLVEEEAAGEITGSVLGSFDGMRGWVRRLATRPDRRGRGIATRLVAELERRLLAAGCPKVNLLIEPGNAAVASFYARLGYQQDDLLFMEKRLAGEPALAPAFPARGRWHGIEPDLSPDQYVFTAPGRPGPPGPPGPPGAPDAPDLVDPLPSGLQPFAVIREDEGLTVILTRADADRAGLRYGYLAARITLRVNSALADVGLTALVSRILADAGISCNVIAGLAHDHLFVDWDRGPHALALLRDL
jgi:uncharacterized protein